MVVAYNLTIHTLGGFFVILILLTDCIDFAIVLKINWLKRLNWQVHFKNTNGCNNNIVNIETDPELCSLYGIKSNSRLNSLQYFHVTDGLHPNIAYDIFEGIAVDVMDDVLLGQISVSNVFTIDFVNKAIASFEYSKIDRKNKPQPFK